jgi:hypothetical protein
VLYYTPFKPDRKESAIAYVTYTDRDNITTFDSEKEPWAGLWCLERSTTEDSKDVASSTISLTINSSLLWEVERFYTGYAAGEAEW